MRAATSLHPDQIRLLFDKKLQQLRSFHFFVQYRFPMFIYTMNLKNLFCEINPNSRHLHGGRSFRLGYQYTPNLAHPCRFERGASIPL